MDGWMNELDGLIYERKEGKREGEKRKKRKDVMEKRMKGWMKE